MRYHRTFGLDAGQLDELEARIEDILPDPWDKGTGRPKSLSLREAIMVTLLYKRQNIIEEVIADLFGVSQGTVSEIITGFTPLIAQATEEFRPDAVEAKQVTRGRLALVDGTLWPCWSWERAPEMWAGKYKTTGHGSLIIGDEFGNIIFVSDPAPGCDHDMKKREGEVKGLFEVNRDRVSALLLCVFSWWLRCVMNVLCRGCRRCGRACADLPGYGTRRPGGLRAWRAGSGSRTSRS